MFSNINVKLNVRTKEYMLRICERKGKHMQAITLKKEIIVSIVCEPERTYTVCAD